MRFLLLLALPFLYHLAWDGDAPLYNVYRLDETGVTLVGPSVPVNVYLEENIEENRLYTYWVTALDGARESAPSDPLGIYTGRRGDVTRDGVVDERDTRQLANYLAGNNAAVNRQADMDDDFNFTAADLVAVQQEAK